MSKVSFYIENTQNSAVSSMCNLWCHQTDPHGYPQIPFPSMYPNPNSFLPFKSQFTFPHCLSLSMLPSSLQTCQQKHKLDINLSLTTHSVIERSCQIIKFSSQMLLNPSSCPATVRCRASCLTIVITSFSPMAQLLLLQIKLFSIFVIKNIIPSFFSSVWKCEYCFLI